ncbi:MAG: hypothetical protein RLZ98_3022 [Pseudomonadota bacterium]|jgi:tripartite-type tricarboxylate transporter receptor subunit TctC
MTQALLRGSLIVAGAAFLSATSPADLRAETVEEFYKGKQLKFIIHSKPGGAYDAWARLIGPHLVRYLPGQPTFVPTNMPGGGGIIAANHLYVAAAQDGSVAGIIGRNLPYFALTKKKNVRYDPRKFNWLGSPELTSRVCAVTDKSPVKKAEELFEKEVLMGGAGAGTAVSTGPTMLNRLLGTKFKLVEGYGGSTDIQLAMERNEVHGICQSLSSLEEAMPGGIKSGKIIVLFNYERKPVPGLNAPSIQQFAKTEEQRKLLNLFSSTVEFGRPFVAPPNVPADRVKALRVAFIKALEDPKMRKDAESQHKSISVLNGEELTALINDMMDTPPALVEKLNELTK